MALIKIPRAIARTSANLLSRKSASKSSSSSRQSSSSKRSSTGSGSGSGAARSSWKSSLLFFRPTEEEESKEEEKEFLLDRLGGPEVLTTIINSFYKRVLNDDLFKPYFENVNMRLLKNHQQRFFTMAFTEIPTDYNIDKMIIMTHQRLFQMGVNEVHFDRIIQHMTDALKERGFPQSIVTEAVDTILPIRRCFQHQIRLLPPDNDRKLLTIKSERLVMKNP